MSLAVAVVKELAGVDAVVPKNESDSVRLRSFEMSLNGVTVELCSWGASIRRLMVPNYALSNNDIRNSAGADADNIVLGYDSAADMATSGNPAFLGAVVGPVANRIANGTFVLNDATYHLPLNDNAKHHLHGGPGGFSHCNWNSEITQSITSSRTSDCAVQFTVVRKDGQLGYPGTVVTTATYALTSSQSEDGRGVRLTLDLKACLLLDKGKTVETPVNLAQHSYFNLASDKAPDGIKDHILSMPHSTAYLPTDPTCIPTRQIVSLNDAPNFDFRHGKVMGDALLNVQIEQESANNIEPPYGFDHTYVLSHSSESDQEGDDLLIAGIIEHPPTGRKLTVRTNSPGVQLYTGHYLSTEELGGYGPSQGMKTDQSSATDQVQMK
eukprot:scaffold79588_cov53-Attheya_sp.AAC.1